MNHEELLFYDIEVFKYDSLVVFLNYDGTEAGHYWSLMGNEDDPNGFEDVVNTISGKTLVGYNNHYYDDIVLSAMMAGRPQNDIKAVNDELIEGGRVNRFKFVQQDFTKSSLDCMQQIDVSRPSLKKIEGNMGMSIVESSVPFDIDRALTAEEREEVLQYCRHDVEATIEVYKLREKSYFQTKSQLLDMLGNERAAKWNTTTISANLLCKDKTRHWVKPESLPQEFRDRFRKVEGIPEEIWQLWECDGDDVYRRLRDKNTPMPKGIAITMFGCEITFGFGGLHGVHKTRKKFSKVKLLDVSSMYPSIISLMRALGASTDVYDSIRQERIKIKHTDPIRSSALKLILNSVYGLLKSEYSTLYNPYASYVVCVYGQMALFDLSRKLHEAGYTLVNLNTDGVAFVDDKEIGNETYEEIWHEWEEDWKLNLELDEFDTWLQKDVNNYIATKDGHIKVKGGEVNKYYENKYFNNNDARIVQIALVDYLVKGIEPSTTIEKNRDNPLLYQYVLKAGNTYKGVEDESGNVYNNVNRVFAGNERCKDGVKLQKVRQDGGKVNFPDTPKRMMVWNDDLTQLKDFGKFIDVDHYKQIVDKKLEGWRCI